MQVLSLALAVGLIIAGELSGSGNAQTTEDAASTLDGEGVFGDRTPATSDALAREMVNDAPCGRQTVAVLTDQTGEANYSFCVFDEGATGVLEVLSDRLRSASVLGATSESSRRIFETLVDDAPEYVLRALDTADAPDQNEIFRATIPTSKLRVLDASAGNLSADTPTAASGVNYCTNGTAWRDEYLGNSAWFYRRELNCTNHHLWGGYGYCSTGDHRFVNPDNTAGWSQRTAAAYSNTSNGACAAYAQLHSCGGSTLFRAYRRSSPGSGAWQTSLNFWVGNGGTATWYMYASGDRCRPNMDKDDFRFRADSDASSGATHRFGYMFVQAISHLSPCVACTSD